MTDLPSWKDKPSQAGEVLDEDDAAMIKALLALEFQQRRIAALFDVNQGRISEIATGARFGDVEALEISR